MIMSMNALLTSNLGDKVEITPPMGAGEPRRALATIRAITLIIRYDR
jgi:hypothetical protein